MYWFLTQFILFRHSYQQHVDGGMFAHDPASSALTLVLSRIQTFC